MAKPSNQALPASAIAPAAVKELTFADLIKEVRDKKQASEKAAVDLQARRVEARDAFWSRCETFMAEQKIGSGGSVQKEYGRETTIAAGSERSSFAFEALDKDRYSVKVGNRQAQETDLRGAMLDFLTACSFKI